MAHRRFGAMYARSFERRPWLTLAVANGTLGALADTLAQTLERWDRRNAPSPSARLEAKVGKKAVSRGQPSDTSTASQPWDVARTSRFFAFGVMMAPLLDQWNRFIEHRFPLRPAVGGPSGAGTVAATGARAGGAAAAVGKVSMAALAKRVAVDQILLCVIKGRARDSSGVLGCADRLHTVACCLPVARRLASSASSAPWA